MRKRGTTNFGLRIEAMVGALTWVVHQALGGKLPLDAFTPHLKDAVADSGQGGARNVIQLADSTPEEVFAMMTRLATATQASLAPNKRSDRRKKKVIRTFTPAKK